MINGLNVLERVSGHSGLPVGIKGTVNASDLKGVTASELGDLKYFHCQCFDLMYFGTGV